MIVASDDATITSGAPPAIVTPPARATPTAIASPTANPAKGSEPSTPSESPTPSEPLGVRLPEELPRAEAFWDRGLRYRFFSEPAVTVTDGMPEVSLRDRPLVDGHVGFKLHVDAAGFVERGGIQDINDRVEVRRAFLTTSGLIRLLHPVEYDVEFGVVSEGFYVDSAWLRTRDVPWIGTLKIGALDAPIGFDNLVSSRDRIFMEVPAPIQAFVPSTSPGIQAARTFAVDRGTWALGWFTVGQRRDVGDDSRALARAVGRVTWLLREGDDGDARERFPLLHVGLAGSYTFSGANSVHYRSRPESFLAPFAVDTDTIDASQAFVLDAEVAARRGRLSLQAEYLQAFVDHASLTFPGLYVAAAYVLTGETRPYDRERGVFGQVEPDHPVGVRPWSFGALECAARYSWVSLDDGPVAGGRMHVISAGLNWYWNPWVRWQFDHEFALVDGGPLDGRLHVFQARFQLVF